MDAACIVSKLHADLLRGISEKEGRHFEGLRAAASHLRRHGKLNARLIKKLTILDEAHNLVRHIAT